MLMKEKKRPNERNKQYEMKQSRKLERIMKETKKDNKNN